MPTITFTLPISGTVITAGLHSANYSALQTLLNGGLDNANITAGAGIDLSKLAAAPWSSYSPAWTSSGVAPALGNGTLTGKYIQIGKTVICKLSFAAGTTTTFGTGSYRFSLPVTAISAFPAVGVARVLDSSAGATLMATAWLLSTVVVRFVYPTVAPFGVEAEVAATTPMTFATSDTIDTTFTYEAA